MYVKQKILIIISSHYTDSAWANTFQMMSVTESLLLSTAVFLPAKENLEIPVILICNFLFPLGSMASHWLLTNKCT